MRRTSSCLVVVAMVAFPSATLLNSPAAAANSAHRITNDWLRSQVAAARAMQPQQTRRPAQAGMHPSATGRLLPAGDLNRDGHPDLLDSRVAEVTPSNYLLGLTARDGRSGKPIWSASYPDPGGVALQAAPAIVGKKARPGVILTSLTTMSDGTTETDDVGLAALSGKAGKPLWVRHVSGTVTFSPFTRTNVPRLQGPVRDQASATPDYLITRATTGAANTDQVSITVVSGQDGSVRTLGGTLTESSAVPAVLVGVPDENGDGLGDVLALLAGKPGQAVVLRGTNGHVIWHNDALKLNSPVRVTLVGHYSDATHSDVAFEDLVLGKVTVLNGATGTVVWRKAGSAYLIGRVGKKPALGLSTQTAPVVPPTLTETVNYRAIAPQGHTLYAGSFAASVPLPADWNSAGNAGALISFGDVEPDGALDAQATIEVSSNSPTESHAKTLTGLVDGATGKFHKVPFDVGSFGSLHKGAGTDLVATSVDQGVVQLTTWNGNTRKKFYTRTLKKFTGSQGVDVAGARVSGADCSDLTIGAVNGASNKLGVLSARGAPLWTVSYSATQATGGARHHYKRPKHLCV